VFETRASGSWLMRLGVGSTKDAKIIGRIYGEWDLGSAPFYIVKTLCTA
jgi:hypothetical protein